MLLQRRGGEFGPGGGTELAGEWAEARPAVEHWLRQECGLVGAEVGRAIASLGKDSEVTAYVFRFLHCTTYLAYGDEAEPTWISRESRVSAW